MFLTSSITEGVCNSVAHVPEVGLVILLPFRKSWWILDPLLYQAHKLPEGRLEQFSAVSRLRILATILHTIIKNFILLVLIIFIHY